MTRPVPITALTIHAALCFSSAVLAVAPAQAAAAQPAGVQLFAITEYRITGSTKLTELERGEAVYPYLGSARTVGDIEMARTALEKSYREKGFETVVVEVPVAHPRGGVVHLKVTENAVGYIWVNGARYFRPSRIKAQLPSLQPGGVPNFRELQRDLIAVNQAPDRRVSPALKAGAVPGTVDIDLTVEDKLPLHGSLELNNRHSTGTSDLRLNGSFSYNNLWQLNHTIGGSFQIAPENLEEVSVYSGYYLARFPQWPGFSLLLQGTKQDSNVSTLGGGAVAGRGENLGLRGILTLPGREGFTHSASVGFDYKNYEQLVNFATTTALTTPVTYYPITAGYSAGFVGEKYQTNLNAGVTFAFRGAGSDEAEFDLNRFKSRGSFIYLRGELEHTQQLAKGAEAYGNVQAQVSSQPLVSSEQFAGGGLGTVRGYLEAEALGDDGVFGTLELRSPSLLGWMKRKDSEWRLYGFVEGGTVSLHAALPEQQSRFDLASAGFGTRIQLFDYFHGSLDVAFPFTSLTTTQAGSAVLTFRLWAEF